MGWRTKVLKTVGLLVMGGYAGLLGLTKLAYRTVLYPAPRHGLESAPAGAMLRSFSASDGVPVQAVGFAAPEGARTVVFFHGNGETIADAVGLGRALSRRGLGFLAVEYRGYGASRSAAHPGPTEPGLYRDAEAALDGLAADGLTPEDIVLWGSSLGSGVAVEMAVQGRACRLILSMPFTSVPAVAARHLPILPMSRLMADEYDNLSKAARVGVPTLIIHGDRDGIVPYDMGVELSRAIADASLLTVPGGGHNDLFVRAPDELLGAIAEHASGSR